MNWRANDQSSSKPFIEHLEDLRRTIIWSLIFLTVGVFVAIPFAPVILDLLKRPLVTAGRDPDTFLQVLRVTGGLSVGMRVIFWSGLLLSLPFILLSIAHFVFPGLTAREKLAVRRAFQFGVGLFAVGVAMGYFVTLPVALQVMFRVNRWLGVDCSFVELSDYVSFILRLLIAFGLVFQLPVIVLILGWIGILNWRQLTKARPYVIVAIMTVSMLLTPPDPVTMILMGVPLILLYEICVMLLRMGARRRV